MKLPESFTKVTPLSKIIALILFVSLPFVGFYFGFVYAKSFNYESEHPVCIPKNIIPTTTINNQSVTNPSVNNDLRAAKKTLFTYFTLLNEKKYSEATQYHGSGYDYLQEWNPDVNKSNYAQLLERGCTRNGLHCLKISTVLEEKITSPTEFSFKVQFFDDDGTIFKRGPCCGATEEQTPTEYSFDFIVKKINNNYLITSQPVYTP